MKSNAESVLEESKQNLTEKTNELKAQEKLIEDMSLKIQYLESAISDMKVWFLRYNAQHVASSLYLFFKFSHSHVRIY